VDARDDKELWAAWDSGDDAAGNAFVERHFSSIFRFFRAKVPHYADELTQRTFLACIEGKHRFDQQRSIRAYLFGIAQKQLLRHYEGRSRKFTATEIGQQSVADLGPSPSTVLAVREGDEILLRALERIPLDFQAVVELFYWEGMSVIEIAAALELPEGTVRSRLTRARRHLMRQLDELDPGGRHDDLQARAKALGNTLLRR